MGKRREFTARVQRCPYVWLYLKDTVPSYMRQREAGMHIQAG